MVVRDQDLSRAQTRPAVFCINGWAEECAAIQTLQCVSIRDATEVSGMCKGLTAEVYSRASI